MLLEGEASRIRIRWMDQNFPLETFEKSGRKCCVSQNTCDETHLPVSDLLSDLPLYRYSHCKIVVMQIYLAQECQATAKGKRTVVNVLPKTLPFRVRKLYFCLSKLLCTMFTVLKISWEILARYR